MVNSVIDEMDLEESRIAEYKASKKVVSANGHTFVNTFLLLGDGQKALFRPLVNLDGAVLMYMHLIFNSATRKTINAVCNKKEFGLPCQYCGEAEENKKLLPIPTFMFPAYIHRITYTKEVYNQFLKQTFRAGEAVTYTDADKNLQPVQGVRIIRLTFSGAMEVTSQQLKTRFKDGDDLRRRDLSLERQGGDKDTKYVLDPKDPSVSNLKLAALTGDRIRERVIEVCPPVLPTSSVPASAKESIHIVKDVPTGEDENVNLEF